MMVCARCGEIDVVKKENRFATAAARRLHIPAKEAMKVSPAPGDIIMRKTARADDSDERVRPDAIDSSERNLHLLVYRKYLSDSQAWWDTINSNVKWHRVKYASNRFGKACETPCYTAFYGGFPQFEPYSPVPAWLQPLVDRVSSELGVPFNAFLLRLYFDGADEIAWHTDGRTFLGPTPTIGSLSLGATAQFEMRRMRNCWPKVGPPKDGEAHDDGIDHATAPMAFALSDGDLIVMRGDTQAHWHHRVPKAKSRRPRININFRYIIPGTEDAERGQATYYKYMRDGDVPEQGMAYEQILRRSGSLLGFASRGAGAAAVEAAPIPTTAVVAPAKPAAAAARDASPAADSSEWACPQCTLFNPPLAPVCAVCECRRDGSSVEEQTQQAARRSSAARGWQKPPPPANKRPRADERTLASMWASR